MSFSGGPCPAQIIEGFKPASRRIDSRFIAGSTEKIRGGSRTKGSIPVT
jgi:hypothetical protein